MKKLTLILLISVFALVGCVTPPTSTFNYKINDPILADNERQVNKPFEVVWDNLVRELAKSFFVVNNVSKESRLINVSFSSSSPEKYIDCGRSMRTLTDSQGKKYYDYEVAADSSYKLSETHPPLFFISHIDRKTNLEGRINIYVAPEGRNTIVTVNVRYIFTIETSGRSSEHNLYGQIIRWNTVPSHTYSDSFNTSELYKNNDGTVCFTKGVLETQILDIANLN